MTRANGFTLVELLAAMVAGSLLLVAVSAATGSLSREARRSDVEKEAAQLARVAPTLERLITSLQPGDTDKAGVQVTPNSIAGEILPPASLGPVGPIDMTLDVQRDPQGEALILSLKAIDPSASLPAVASEPVKLVSGFRDISFSSSPRTTGDKTSVGMILITFVGDNSVQRTLAFDPKVTTSGACRFDPISLACR